MGMRGEGREEGSESISGKTTEGNLREEESKAKAKVALKPYLFWDLQDDGFFHH